VLPASDAIANEHRDRSSPWSPNAFHCRLVSHASDRDTRIQGTLVVDRGVTYQQRELSYCVAFAPSRTSSSLLGRGVTLEAARCTMGKRPSHKQLDPAAGDTNDVEGDSNALVRRRFRDETDEWPSDNGTVVADER
jgi:hypothetical protein